ncbi:MAG: tetratricopeptide repeat protein, partial [Victivallales bacterium]|nr:tetratricopeptide repeat protein [Victivallales bacterium]
LGMSASVQAASKVEPADAICEAYASMQYPLARTLVKKHPDLQEARLVKALTAVFDRRKQDLSYGLPELKKIYEDSNFREPLRIQGGLAYARAVQTLQMRPGVYSQAEGMEFDPVYDVIISKYPATPAACFALIYQTEGWFGSGNEDMIAKAFAKLENFIQNYRGPNKYFAGLNVMLADRYIIHNRQYDKAVTRLVVALENGVSNPRTAELISFQVGRIFDTQLGDRKQAQKYYKRFIEKYPNSGYASIVQRYMNEMNEKNIANGGK